MRKLFTILFVILICFVIVCATETFAAGAAHEAKYSGIITAYRHYAANPSEDDASENLFAKVAGLTGIDPDYSNNNKSYGLNCSIDEIRFEPSENLGYSFHDLNNDGVPELFVITSDYTITAVYSLVNDNPILVGAYWSRNRCVIDKSGTLYINGSSGADDSFGASYLFNGGEELQLIEMVGVEDYDELTQQSLTEPRWYRIKDGEKTIISENEADTAREKIPDTYPDNPTKDAGLTFNPLL